MNAHRLFWVALGALACILVAGLSNHAGAAPPQQVPAPNRAAAPLATDTPTVTATPPVCPGELQDVPPGTPDYSLIHCVVCQGWMVAFVCGGPGEPCVPPNNWPYFRPTTPYSNTRGDIA